MDKFLLPGVFDVFLEERAQWPVIICTSETSVNLGAGKNESAALGQRHKLLHQIAAFVVTQLGHSLNYNCYRDLV